MRSVTFSSRITRVVPDIDKTRIYVPKCSFELIQYISPSVHFIYFMTWHGPPLGQGAARYIRICITRHGIHGSMVGEGGYSFTATAMVMSLCWSPPKNALNSRVCYTHIRAIVHVACLATRITVSPENQKDAIRSVMKSCPPFPNRPDVDLNGDLGLPISEHLLFSCKAIGTTCLERLRKISTMVLWEYERDISGPL
jgi:hypothetical protein